MRTCITQSCRARHGTIFGATLKGMPDPIQHVVILMFENNSFDRMLGCMKAIYPDVDGIPNPPFTNLDFPDPNHLFAQLPDAEFVMQTDPGHEVDDVLRQIHNGCSGFVADFVQHCPKAPKDEQYPD